MQHADPVETYGLSVAWLTKHAQVHPDTARRWKRAGRIPEPYAALVKLRANGDLGELNSTWTGWSLGDGVLWTPENAAVAPGDIRAIPYRKEQVAALEKALREPQQFDLFGSPLSHGSARKHHTTDSRQPADAGPADCHESSLSRSPPLQVSVGKVLRGEVREKREYRTAIVPRETIS